VSVHAIMVNIHLLVACGILPEYYCTDASLRRYAMLIVALRISSGRAEWLIDIILAARQKRDYFITFSMHMPQTVGCR